MRTNDFDFIDDNDEDVIHWDTPLSEIEEHVRNLTGRSIQEPEDDSIYYGDYGC